MTIKLDEKITPAIPVIARFEKVSYHQFKKDCMELLKAVLFHNINHETYCEIKIKKAYDSITIPRIKTPGSSGHDFYSPFSFNMTSDPLTTEIDFHKTVIVPTGIKCYIEPGWQLWLLPRSNYGFKHRLQLDNTVGVIDNDHYNNKENEGHIYIKVTCDSIYRNHKLFIIPEKAFAQAIFLPYGLAERPKDADLETRNGGIGSTN